MAFVLGELSHGHRNEGSCLRFSKTGTEAMAFLREHMALSRCCYCLSQEDPGGSVGGGVGYGGGRGSWRPWS